MLNLITRILSTTKEKESRRSDDTHPRHRLRRSAPMSHQSVFKFCAQFARRRQGSKYKRPVNRDGWRRAHPNANGVIQLVENVDFTPDNPATAHLVDQLTQRFSSLAAFSTTRRGKNLHADIRIAHLASALCTPSLVTHSKTPATHVAVKRHKQQKTQFPRLPLRLYKRDGSRPAYGYKHAPTPGLSDSFAPAGKATIRKRRA